MTTTFREHLSEQLRDPEFKAEYDRTQSNFDIVHAIFEAYKTGFTRETLSDKSGISKYTISKLEAAEANPSLNTLQKLAEAMGKRLHIEFQPL